MNKLKEMLKFTYVKLHIKNIEKLIILNPLYLGKTKISEKNLLKNRDLLTYLKER